MCALDCVATCIKEEMLERFDIDPMFENNVMPSEGIMSMRSLEGVDWKGSRAYRQ